LRRSKTAWLKDLGFKVMKAGAAVATGSRCYDASENKFYLHFAVILPIFVLIIQTTTTLG